MARKRFTAEQIIIISEITRPDCVAFGRPPQRAIQHASGGLGHPWRNALRPALSALRDENLCIVRACLKLIQS